jgi:hypothetical protein
MISELRVLAVKRLARFWRGDLPPVIVAPGLASIDDGVGWRSVRRSFSLLSSPDVDAAKDSGGEDGADDVPPLVQVQCRHGLME